MMQQHEVKSTLAISQEMLTRALRVAREQPEGAYENTEHRTRMRTLLEAAGWVQAPLLCAFVKADGTLRYMQCEVVPGADSTARYVTVKDLEATAEAGRVMYRRVCLDTLVGVTATYHA